MIDYKIDALSVTSGDTILDALITYERERRMGRCQGTAEAFTDEPMAVNPGDMDCRGHLDRLSHPDPCELFKTVTTPTIRLPLLIYATCLFRFLNKANGQTHTN